MGMITNVIHIPELCRSLYDLYENALIILVLLTDMQCVVLRITIFYNQNKTMHNTSEAPKTYAI